jgi:hypothetical protein
MELEEPGVMEADLQVGWVKGPTAGRVVVPDVEVDLGLDRNVELDLDWTYAIEGPDGRAFSFDHAAPDNLWIASKVGLFDYRCPECRSSWAIGMQLGPKAPMARGVRGVGFEGILIINRRVRRTQIALNLGGLIDPGGQVATDRPRGLEAGLDLTVDLDDQGKLSLVGELGAVHYDPEHSDQLHATFGWQWQATEKAQLSVVGLKGLGADDDQWGILLGLAYKATVF